MNILRYACYELQSKGNYKLLKLHKIPGIFMFNSMAIFLTKLLNSTLRFGI